MGVNDKYGALIGQSRHQNDMAGIHTLLPSVNMGSPTRMPALLRKFNYRNIVLTNHTEAENVGVLDDTDHPRYFPWLGFISSDVLESPYCAINVRLEINAYSLGDADYGPWMPIPEGKTIEGLFTHRGVYAVLDRDVPRFI